MKQLIVDRVVEYHHGCSSHLLSPDHCNMLQYVSDNGVVIMNKIQFTSNIANRPVERLSADGVVCHFDQCPSLQDVIFTSPHWLNNIITSLTSPVGCATIRGVDDGVITKQLLDQMLHVHNTATTTTTTTLKLTEVMMSLLVHLNLAVPLSSNINSEAVLVSNDKATRALLIPSLIISNSSTVTSLPTLFTDTTILFTTTTGVLVRRSYSATQLLVKLLTWGLSNGHHLLRSVL